MCKRLPKVVTTSVIRSAHKGKSHGGIYIVDLQTEDIQKVVDWDDRSIEWSGQGGERGLRGIVCGEESIYIASNDTIYCYNESFEIEKNWTNLYLDHAHEIEYKHGIIYVTSTKFDAILKFDIEEEKFLNSFCTRSLTNLDKSFAENLTERLKKKFGLDTSVQPTFTSFDPSCDDGPEPKDTFHINSVSVRDGRVFFSGTQMAGLYTTARNRIRKFADLPEGTHNAQPFRDGVLYNNTSAENVCFARRDGTVVNKAPIKRYREENLQNNDLPDDYARQAFGRGLCTYKDEYVIAGSSPATISIYRVPEMEVVKRVNISMDKRNAIHGLEVLK